MTSLRQRFGPLFSALALYCLSGAAALAAEGSSWFRDEELRISFAYGKIWTPTQAAESATRQVVSWRGRDGEGLVATCYLQTYSGSQLSRLPPEQLHANAKAIVQTFMTNMGIRYSKRLLISSEPTFVDGQPVIFLVRDGWMNNLGEEIALRAWTIVTVWKQNEVVFECGSPIPHQFPGHEVVATVEAGVMKVLKTLHFERLQ